MQLPEITNIIALTIGPDDGWQRLDSFLGKALEGRMSREKVKKAVQEGRVTLNGKPCLVPKTKVGPGDAVGIELPAPAQGPQPEAGELEILYRDADLAVINKPAGLTVHPCPSCPSGTLVNRLLAHFPELSSMGAGQEGAGGTNHEPYGGLDDESGEDWGETRKNGLANGEPEPWEERAEGDGSGAFEFDDSVFFAQDGDRPGIVHRLDKDTTGLLLVALNEPARLRLAEDFASRRVRKEYLALVYGVPAEAAGRIDAPIGRDPENKTRMKAFAAREGRRFAAGSAVMGGNALYEEFAESGYSDEAVGSFGTARTGGREALSDYRVLYADPARRFSLLAVRIHTGRTHQIRVHLRFIGHPIIGDSAYFDFNAAKPLFNDLAGGKVNSRAELDAFFSRVASRPLLHAWKLIFEHPQRLEDFSAAVSPEAEAALERGAREAVPCGSMEAAGELSGFEMAFCCPPPEDFFHAARELSRLMQRVVLTGNSGCGKSSVLARLGGLHAPTNPANPACPADLRGPAGTSVAGGNGVGIAMPKTTDGSDSMAAKAVNGSAVCAALPSAPERSGIPVWSADRAVAESYETGGDGWRLLRSAFRTASGGSRFVPDDDSPVDKKALFKAMFNDETLRRDVERIVHPIADRSMHDFFRRYDFWAHPQEWPQAAVCASKESIKGGEEPARTDVAAATPTGSALSGLPQERRGAPWQGNPLPELQPALVVAEVPLYFESAHLDKGVNKAQGKIQGKARERSVEAGNRAAWMLGSDARPLVLGVHCPRELRVQRLKSGRNWPDSMIDKMESWQWPEDKKMQACDLVLDNSGSLADLDRNLAVLLEELARLRLRRLDEIADALRALCACG